MQKEDNTEDMIHKMELYVDVSRNELELSF